MGIYEYEAGYKRTYNKRYGIRGSRKVAKVIDDKIKYFEIYIKSRGISWEEIGRVIGLSGKGMKEYVRDNGVTGVVVDIIYILVGDDIKYMANERVI